MKNEQKLKTLLSKLQDDILDEYNKHEVSYDEMVKIMEWTKRIIEAKLKNPNSRALVIDLRDKDKDKNEDKS